MQRTQKIEPSLNRLTNQVPGQTTRETGGMGEAIVALGKTGVQIGDALRQASSLHEKTRAQNYRDTALRDIENRAAQDNDVSEERAQKYRDEIDDAVANSAKMLTIPEERDLFHMESLSKAEISHTDIRNSFTKKNIDLGAAELDIYNDNKLNEYVTAGNPKDKQRAIVERNVKIKEAVDAHYIDPAGAVKMQHEMDKKWGEAQVEYDIATKPEIAIERLEQNDYPYIDESKRAKFINDARTAENKITSDLKDQLKKSQITNEAKYVEEFMKGNRDLSSVTQVGEAIAKREIRPEFGNAIIKAIQKPLEDVDLDDEGEAFMSMVDSLLNASESGDINNAVMDILNGFSSGNLGQDKMQILIQGAMKFQSGDKEIKNQMSNVINNSLKAGFVNDPDAAADYLMQINQGIKPVEAAAIAIRNKQIKEVPERATYVVGQIIKRGNRSAKVVGYREDGMPLMEVVVNAQ